MSMSERAKNLLTIVMLMVLATSAFVAGYFTNTFVSARSSNALTTTNQNDTNDFSVFLEAWDIVNDHYIGELPSSTEWTYAALEGAMGSLTDRYTVFIRPVARNQEVESLRGTFGGIGAYITRPEDGGDIILDPIPGNPAEKAGIQKGDVLLAVDGTELTAEMTVNDVVALIKGEKGTAVTLTVLHPEATEPTEIEVVRDDILIPSVSSTLLDEDETIGYIVLTRFSGESSNEIAEAVQSLQEQGAQKLILDLRNNGGGLLQAAVDVADHFLGDVPIVYQQNSRDGDERVTNATSETIAPDMPLVVLINGGTASASEILAGALQDHERAQLVGQKSFGKGSVQLVFDLRDGSSVHVTASRWFTPNRQQIDEQGLTPDMTVEQTQEAIDNGRDEILNQAIELLSEE